MTRRSTTVGFAVGALAGVSVLLRLGDVDTIGGAAATVVIAGCSCAAAWAAAEGVISRRRR